MVTRRLHRELLLDIDFEHIAHIFQTIPKSVTSTPASSPSPLPLPPRQAVPLTQCRFLRRWRNDNARVVLQEPVVQPAEITIPSEDAKVLLPEMVGVARPRSYRVDGVLVYGVNAGSDRRRVGYCDVKGGLPRWIVLQRWWLNTMNARVLSVYRGLWVIP